MPVLSVDSLRCLRDTAELSADEVYLLALVARLRPEPSLSLQALAPKEWRDLRSGTRRDVDSIITHDFDHLHSACLVLLLEQDGERNLDLAAARQALEQDLCQAFDSFASIHGIALSDVVQQLRIQLDQSVPRLCGNDHVVGEAAVLDFSRSGKTTSVRLGDGNGRYLVGFKLTP